MSVAEVLTEIVRDRVFYEESGGGVTLSGGEPLEQGDFCAALLARCQDGGIHTAMDTCGYAPWEVVDRIRGKVDLFLYDIKLVDPNRHREFTGEANGLILSNLCKLSELGHEIILRLPLIPGVNDDDENLREIGRFATSLPRLQGLDILRYHRAGIEKYGRLGRECALAGARPVADERLIEVMALLASCGLAARVVE